MISDETLMGYLDGHADPDRVREIDVALNADPRLRARLAELEATDRSVRAAFDTLLETPVPDRLVELVRAAGSAPDNVVALPQRPRKEKMLEPVARAWRSAPPWLGLAAAVQAGLIVLAAVLFHAAPQSRQSAAPAAYEALGAKPAAAAANALVVFKPETPEGEFRAALRAADARIVGGPTSADAYLINLPPAGRGAALSQLRGRGDVLVAEPIDAPGTEP